MFNFFKTNMKLNCKSAGLQFHNNLVNTTWKDIEDYKSGNKPTFYEPYTACRGNQCLLLTGYSFILEDENGREKREIVEVFDVLSGAEEYSLGYGWGHLSETGNGSRNKSEQDIESDNISMEIHKNLLQEFRFGGKLKTLDNWSKYWSEYGKKYWNTK